MLIVGGKKNILDLNDLIDSFDETVRANLSVPEGKNGTKVGILYVNNHVYYRFVRKKMGVKELKKFYSGVPSEYLCLFHNIIDKKKYVHIREMMEVGNTKSNKILKKYSVPTLSKNARCGLQAIIEYLNKGKEIYIYGFSLIQEDNKSYYNKDSGSNGGGCHEYEEEFLVLKKLHEKNLIDATLCLLEQDTKPVINCSFLVPTRYMVEKLCHYFPVVYIINLDSDKKKLFSGLNVEFQICNDQI